MGGDERVHVKVEFQVGAGRWIDFLTSRNKSEDILGIEAILFSVVA